jgi:hypothetical protein
MNWTLDGYNTTSLTSPRVGDEWRGTRELALECTVDHIFRRSKQCSHFEYTRTRYSRSIVFALFPDNLIFSENYNLRVVFEDDENNHRHPLPLWLSNKDTGMLIQFGLMAR